MGIAAFAVKVGAVVGVGFLGVQAIGTSHGAGIQGRPVTADCIPASLCPATVRITNPGSGTETMTLRLLPSRRGRHLPPSWLHATPVHLDAGKSADAAFTITIPASARPGRYRAQVVAYGSSGFLAGRMNLGAGAGTRLTVTVVRPPHHYANYRRATP